METGFAAACSSIICLGAGALPSALVCLALAIVAVRIAFKGGRA